MKYPLDFTSLEQVVARLSREYAKAEAAKAKDNLDDFESFRTAAIKLFELGYELGIKTMRHYFELVAALPDELDSVNYRNFLRLMAEAGLKVDPDEWGAFRQERNKAVHTYLKPVAEAIYERIPTYIHALQLLLDSLRKKCM